MKGKRRSIDTKPQAELALLEAALETMDQGLVVFDRDLVIQTVNRRLAELLHLPAELFKRGAKFDRVVRHIAERGDYGPGDPDDVTGKFLALARGDEVLRLELNLSDGTAIDIRSNPLPGGGRIATYTDVTDRNRIAAALAESEGRLRATMENVADALVTIDVRGGIRSFNPAAESMFGYGAADVLGKNVSVLMTEPDRSAHDGYIHAYLETGKGKILGVGAREVTARRKDGSTFPMELTVSGMKLGKEPVFIGAMRDISERMQAEKQLRESEGNLRAVLDFSPVIIALKDVDGRYLVFNKRLCELVGMTEQEIKGKTEYDIYPREFADLVSDQDRAMLETGLPITQDVSFPLADGIRSYLTTKFPINDSLGNLIGIGLIATDITNRKHHERSVENAKQSAELANRSKSEFLANMSHELRTPLNAVIGFSEVIMSELLGPVGNAKYLEYAKDINSSGQHLLALINDILDLSKIEAGKLELHEQVVDVSEVLDASMNLVKERAEEAALSLEIHVSDGLPAIIADQIKLKQALINLLSNAVKFTGPGGTISVHAYVETDGNIAIQVADTGIGIAAEDIPKVMESFGQSDNSLTRRHQGTGLGLPLSKALIELHQGTLVLESELGVGTTVTIRFPVERVRDRAA